jgi:hypothetical protein
VAWAGPALADEILLESGGKLVGKARRVGDEVVVTMPSGEARLKASEVRSITPGRTVFDDHADRVAALDAKDAAAHVALGDWCREKGLGADARKHWRDALALDADQADARARLGFVRYEDKWLTPDEYRKARGFVKVGEEWVPEDEARRRDAARLEKAAFDRHVKRIRSGMMKLASMKRKTRALGKLELQRYAEELGDTRLAAFASDAAAYSNAYWTEVKKALVLVEVRATQATLKRPIPTLTTSLGANTTPVTIQLPELSVVSVKTTALVPAEIELDE